MNAVSECSRMKSRSDFLSREVRFGITLQNIITVSECSRMKSRSDFLSRELRFGISRPESYDSGFLVPRATIRDYSFTHLK